MELFRGREVRKVQLYLRHESAYATVAELAEKGGLIQFLDQNDPKERLFTNEIRRCDDLERTLRLQEQQLLDHELEIPLANLGIEYPQPKELIDLEAIISNTSSELQESKLNLESLNDARLKLLECKSILTHGDTILEGASAITLLNESDRLVQYTAGVIDSTQIEILRRSLWRFSRGKALLETIDLDIPELDNKTACFVVYQGENLHKKMAKVCEAYGMNIYSYSENLAERTSMIKDLNIRLEDLAQVINKTDDHKYRMLKKCSNELRENFVKVGKMKQVYQALNTFTYDGKCLIGEAWVVTEHLEAVRDTIEEASAKYGNVAPSVIYPIESKEEPPTYNKTNKFTEGFQNIVNAYGVGSYQEVNPGLFTVISFPFIFATMFGDAGHGILMTLFALALVLKEKKIKPMVKNNEIFKTFYDGRYIILLMGLFSIYTGLVYNDMYSLSTNIFGSSWNAKNIDVNNLQNVDYLQLDPSTSSYLQKPYPLGLDPIWQISKNKILFSNSYKMKLSIILGVTQMLFGVVLSLYNHLHFKETYAIFCEFIPQMIFMIGLFGYLVFMIIYKWIAYSAASSGIAPSLLISFINMFMMKSDGEPMYPGQFAIQKILVILAFLCIPWMLLSKPLYKHLTKKKDENVIEQLPEDGEESESLTDALINQAIHTIEFCLGSISHTASYLRLWALSLAHSQLSEVLWSMIMRIALGSSSYAGAIMLIPIFAAWAVLTLGILLLMEGLSAFLHAIRLHWVEFQSKFYHGAGYIYEPLSFEALIEEHC